MSFSETIFLFVLALVIFGPKKLPEIARYIGKTLAEFRRASNEFKAQIEQEITNLEVESKKQTILPPSPAPEGTAGRTLNAAPTETSDSSASETSASQPTSDAATLAASAEEPPTPHHAEPATEALPDSDSHDAELNHSDPVTSTTTQESHA